MAPPNPISVASFIQTFPDNGLSTGVSKLVDALRELIERERVQEICSVTQSEAILADGSREMTVIVFYR